MTVGRAELGGEIDVATELEHAVVVTLEEASVCSGERLNFLRYSTSFALNALRFSSFMSDMQNMLMAYPCRDRSASKTKLPGISS
jgi:hypothetical protein